MLLLETLCAQFVLQKAPPFRSITLSTAISSLITSDTVGVRFLMSQIALRLGSFLYGAKRLISNAPDEVRQHRRTLLNLWPAVKNMPI